MILSYKLFEKYEKEKLTNNKILSFHKSSLSYLKSFITEGISSDKFSFGHGQGRGFYMYSNIDGNKGLDYTIKVGLIAGGKKDLIIGKYIDINFSNIRVDYELVNQNILLKTIWNIFKKISLSNKNIEFYKLNRRDCIAGKYGNSIKLSTENGLNNDGNKIDHLLNNNIDDLIDLNLFIIIHDDKTKNMIKLDVGQKIESVDRRKNLTLPAAEKLFVELEKFKKSGIDIFEKLDAKIFEVYKEKKETLPIKLIKILNNNLPDYFWILENDKWEKYSYSQIKQNYNEIKNRLNIEEKNVDFKQIQIDVGNLDDLED